MTPRLVEYDLKIAFILQRGVAWCMIESFLSLFFFFHFPLPCYEYGTLSRSKTTAYSTAILKCNEIAEDCGNDYEAFSRVDSLGRVTFLQRINCLYLSSRTPLGELQTEAERNFTNVLVQFPCEFPY